MNRPVSFALHIRPLMRGEDVQHMSFRFDLSKHDDVKTHSAAILDRLRGIGNLMPPRATAAPGRTSGSTCLNDGSRKGISRNRGMATIRDKLGYCLHESFAITSLAGSPSRR
jgi:hypothetical protein